MLSMKLHLSEVKLLLWENIAQKIENWYALLLCVYTGQKRHCCSNRQYLQHEECFPWCMVSPQLEYVCKSVPLKYSVLLALGHRHDQLGTLIFYDDVKFNHLSFNNTGYHARVRYGSEIKCIYHPERTMITSWGWGMLPFYSTYWAFQI